jgi:hypothetical protein
MKGSFRRTHIALGTTGMLAGSDGPLSWMLLTVRISSLIAVSGRSSILSHFGQQIIRDITADKKEL